MSDVVVFSNDILTIFMIFGILGLISTFLLKFYNVLDACDFYDIKISIIVLAIGIISYLFIEVGVLITISQEAEDTILEYNIYFWFARIFIIMLWVFWFAEMIFYAGKSAVDPLKRMSKRREERIKNLY